MRYLFTCLIVFVSNATIAQATWKVLPTSSVKVEGKGMEGEFTGLEGTISFDPGNIKSASFKAQLPTNGYASGNDKKDKHAHGDDWLDAIKFPVIEFTSTQVNQDGADAFVLIGKLSLHGIQKEVKIPFKFSKMESGEGKFEGTLSITREQFDITGPWMAFMVGDEINIAITAMVKQQ